MKLKYLLVSLVVLGFAVGCDKKESTEKQKTVEKQRPVEKQKSKWISPSQKVCKANGGKMHSYDCTANFSNAKDICSASGGNLAIIDVLAKVITDCGGTINALDNNRADSVYHDCYKKKGFTNSSSGYWSSTSVEGEEEKNAWVVFFNYGGVFGYAKDNTYYVRCVRDGQ